jgi:hypothetical protein
MAVLFIWRNKAKHGSKYAEQEDTSKNAKFAGTFNSFKKREKPERHAKRDH